MASRLCVKGLPKYVSEARLREHFSAKGEVTDAKVVRSKYDLCFASLLGLTAPSFVAVSDAIWGADSCRDGTSRQFGFVGFRSAEEATDARNYFNRTFIDTSRISISVWPVTMPSFS